MHSPTQFRRILAFVTIILWFGQLRADLLDDYVGKLRADAAGARQDTGFLSAGADFLSGQDYFEAGNFTSAVWYFRDAARKAENNAFFRYQLGAALLKTGDAHVKADAQGHLAAAFRLQPGLRERHARDFAASTPPPPAEDNPPADLRKGAPGGRRAASLQEYIDGLKRSRAVGGPETAMNTPGQSALYGIEHYESNAFDSAETNFHLALARDRDNPHLNYLMAIALAAQGKDASAHLEKAALGDPRLRAQYDRDLAPRRAQWTQMVEAKKPKTIPAAPTPPPGGALVYGSYVCSETVWNGPNRSPAFRSEPRGYFELKADGTYRWLDDGATGRYRYDASTGVVTWLSGQFGGGGAPQSTIYRRDGKNGLMTIHFSENLRWNVICEKN